MASFTSVANSEPNAQPKVRAYNYIRDQIISGIWQGGTKLQPEQIAEKLDISRMPVRDAISQLDAEGLVTMRPNQSALVTLLPADEVNELFEIRSVLEGLAARRACEALADQDIEDLRLLNDLMERVGVDTPKWLEYHNEFHDRVCAVGNQKHLLNELRRIRTLVQPYLLVYFREYGQERMAGDEHRLLIDALASGNGLLAERAFSQHVLSAAEENVKFVEKMQSGRSAEQGHTTARKKATTANAKTSGRSSKAKKTVT